MLFFRGSLVICCPTLWCGLGTHSVPTSTSHVCTLVVPLFIFTHCGLNFCSVTGSEAPFMSTITSGNLEDVELSLMAAGSHIAKTIEGVSFRFTSDTVFVEGTPSSVYRFLFLDLDSMLGDVDTIIKEATLFSRSSSTDTCCSCTFVSSTFFFFSLSYNKILALKLCSSLFLILVLTFLFSFLF